MNVKIQNFQNIKIDAASRKPKERKGKTERIIFQFYKGKYSMKFQKKKNNNFKEAFLNLIYLFNTQYIDQDIQQILLLFLNGRNNETNCKQKIFLKVGCIYFLFITVI